MRLIGAADVVMGFDGAVLFYPLEIIRKKMMNSGAGRRDLRFYFFALDLVAHVFNGDGLGHGSDAVRQFLADALGKAAVETIIQDKHPRVGSARAAGIRIVRKSRLAVSAFDDNGHN